MRHLPSGCIGVSSYPVGAFWPCAAVMVATAAMSTNETAAGGIVMPSPRRRACRHELLQALTVGVGRTPRTVRIDDDSVDPVELARPETLLPPRRQDLAVLQLKLVNAFEQMVGDIAEPVSSLP